MLRLLMAGALAALATVAGAQPAGLATKELPASVFRLPPINKDQLIEQDLSRREAGALRYGVTKAVGQDLLNRDLPVNSQWQPTKDGRLARRWLIEAPGSESVDVLLSRFWVPHQVELYFYDPQGTTIRGPYTDQHNLDSGVLPLPYVPGEKAILEIIATPDTAPFVELELGSVTQAYRPLWDLSSSTLKSGSCNVDTICPEGDAWRDQIASAGHYTTSGFVCSGQLINAQPTDPRLFLTANHCVSTEQEIQGMVFYFNFESGTCRAVDSVESGTALSRNNFSDTISGASLVATSEISDFTLVRTSAEPPESFGAYWSGWDRSTTPASTVTAIHHPQGHAKRISFENDPLCISEYLEDCGSGNFWRIEDWDLGTTEGGSSGSGIWNPQKRLIGQLRGGFAACGNNDPDWYGRFDISWDGGGTPGTRLKDWLDPNGTNPLSLDGTAGCDAPDVAISSGGGVVGEPINFSANVSGGQGPYTYAWDFDGDGRVDSTQATGQAQYHDAYIGNVSLRVTDATSCAGSATFGVVVPGPDIVTESVGSPTQVCGDGDLEIEPGESWSYPVTLRNNGGAATSNGFAAFGISPAISGAKSTGGPDTFGYTFSDDDEPDCSADFVDITGSGTSLSFSPSSTFDALDDGGATVNLGGPGFSYYGQTVDAVTMSTNGYLSTDAADGGGDYDPICPIPARPDRGSAGGGRLMPFHSDLVLTAGFHQYFSTCPRPSSSGAGGCNVFSWDDTGFFSDPSVSFDFQALLYDDGEIVYQYDPGNLGAGFERAIGIQNPGASDGLEYSCSSNPNPTLSNLAVCIKAPVPRSDTGVTLQQSALPIGSLAPNQTTTVDLVVQIDPTFTCGLAFSVDYLGTGHDKGYSNNRNSSLIVAQVGDGQCNVNNQCPVAGGPTVQPQQGFWFNASRPGNGIDIHLAGQSLYSAWYTAGKNRLPTWYYVEGITNGRNLVNDQLRADILKFTLAGDITQSPPTSVSVGEARFSFIDESKAVMTWTINGEPGGEMIQFFELDVPAVDTTLTDQYFNPGESGWGFGLHRQGSQEFSAIYFYDTAGQPRWVVVASDGTVLVNQGTADLSSAKAHCPGCVWTPVELLPGGTMNRTLNPDGSSVLNSLDISIQQPVNIQWQRSNLPLQQILPE